MPADDDPPTFDDATAEARYYRLQYKDAQDELEDLKLALQDFQASSKELEDEMEKDLAATEKREQELRNEAERLRSDLEGWKSRHQATLKDHSTTMAHMHKELESLRASEKGIRAKLRDMELDNDDLEKSERAISSTLSDMENRYNKAVERTALLEQELVDKARLEEELQRVKDELRDTTEELAVLRDQHDDALAKAASTNSAIPHQGHTQALPVTPSRQNHGETANQSHRNGIPSPDIDSADEGNNLEQQAVIAAERPSLGQSSASSDRVSFLRASPSKLPVSTFSSPDDTYSSPVPFLPQQHQQRASSPTSSTAAISRSLNARNLSTLASRKSLTPKTLRDKRTDSVVGEMQDMTSRMQKLTAHLNSRRESMMAGSAIPRARPSLLPVTPASSSSSTGVPRSSSTKSSISRSGSIRRGLNGSPSMQFSTNSHTSAAGERDDFKQPISTRPPSRLANSSRASVVSQRPQSRLSVNNSRPVTPSARSPTPSSQNYAGIGVGNLPGAVSSRTASRRISMGPGGVRKTVNPPLSTMPGGSSARPKSIDATSSVAASTTKSAAKAAPAWR